MIKKLAYIAISSLLIVSCQEILFSDLEVTRDIPLENFHSVQISGIFNIVFIQDSVNRLVISGKNSVNSIGAEVINDTLKIEDSKAITINTEKNTLYLHFRELEYIATNDPVNFSNEDTIKARNLSFEATGEISEGTMTVDCEYLTVVNSDNTLGYMRFYGKSDYCTICNRYGAVVFADSLSCINADVTNESVGDVYVNPSQSLNAFIRSSGNIYYYGNPVVTISEKRGNGNVIKRN